ncbi:MAG: hypothetical protein DRQ56_05020, partial [Gammaproteobacteria bacterium]
HAWKILQMGRIGWEETLLTEEQKKHYVIIDRNVQSKAPVAVIQGALDALPVATKSMDVVIMPHTLEFESNPQQVLREAKRVLRPEGKLLFLGFNPRGLYRLFHYRLCGRKGIPWCGHFISQHRMHDWLSLLNFEFESDSYSFLPSRKFRQIETVVGKYAPSLTIGYAIIAIKRTYTMTPITPAWASSRLFSPDPVTDSVSRYSNDQDKS